MTESTIHNLPDKDQIAAAFSRAAASYDAVAQLQRQVGQHLLAGLPADIAPTHWLDLGAGTGHFGCALQKRFPSATGLALDLAPGMLAYARAGQSAHYFVAGDAEQLPLTTASQSLIFSSLAVQWCSQFSVVLAEARRVLRPSGMFAFSSLADGSLYELRNSWQAVDQWVHVNPFRSFADYQALTTASGLRVLALYVQPQIVYFSELKPLLQALKALGAQNRNPGRALGLTGPARLRALGKAYEAFRTPQGLPVTYQVVYGWLCKECC